MSETFKCVTISIGGPLPPADPSLTITRIYVRKNKIEVTSLNPTDSLELYDFITNYTLINAPIPKLRKEFWINGNLVHSYEDSNVSTGNLSWTVPGSSLRNQYNWTTVGDMLRALGVTGTTLQICTKFIY